MDQVVTLALLVLGVVITVTSGRAVVRHWRAVPRPRHQVIERVGLTFAGAGLVVWNGAVLALPEGYPGNLGVLALALLFVGVGFRIAAWFLRPSRNRSVPGERGPARRPAPPPHPAFALRPLGPAPVADSTVVAAAFACTDPDSALARLAAAGLSPLPPLIELGRVHGAVVWGWREDDPAPALEAWHRLRAIHQRTGWWPVLVPETDDHFSDLPLDWTRGAEEEPDALAEADALDGAALLREWADGGEFQDDDQDDDSTDDDGQELDPTSLLAPGARGCLVALVPSRSGEDVPATVSWSGAGNYDVTPAQHTAVLRCWGQRYGCELLVLSGETMELLVAAPPQAAAEVRQVAREQAGYCPDVVQEMGGGSLGGVERLQVRRDWWSLWWD